MNDKAQKSSVKKSNKAKQEIVDLTLEQNDKLSEIEETDTLTAEEKEKLYQEMDQIFAQSENKIKDPSRYDITDVPTGKGLPIIFNAVLVAIVGITIAVSMLIINARDAKIIQGNSNELSSESSAIVQEIIAQNKGKLNNQTEELEKIQAQLDNILSGKNNLENFFQEKIDAFEENLESDLNDQQAQLRKDLEAQSMSEAEIQRRLKLQEAELRAEYSALLENYKSEQEVEKARQEAEIAVQVVALQEKQNAKQGEVDKLQAEIARREAELARRAEEASTELGTAQNSLAKLQQDKKKEDTAYKEYGLYHQNVVSLINREEYANAKTAIIRATAFIKGSPYSQNIESKTYLEAFDVYIKMIDETITALQAVDSTNSVIGTGIDSEITQEYEQETQDYLQQIEALETTLANKDKEINSLEIRNKKSSEGASARAQNLASETDRLNTKYAKLQSELQALQSRYEAQTKEIEASRVDETGVSKQAIEDMLGNVKLIATYLNLKKDGVEDARMRSFIIDLKTEFSVYEEIVDSMALAIDSSGRLQF